MANGPVTAGVSVRPLPGLPPNGALICPPKPALGKFPAGLGAPAPNGFAISAFEFGSRVASAMGFSIY